VTAGLDVPPVRAGTARRATALPRPVRHVLGVCVCVLATLALAVVGGSARADGGSSPPFDGRSLADQDGGPCAYAGRRYDHCFVGQAWTGAQRLVDVSDVLVLRSSIADASGGPCLYLRNARRVDLVDLTIAGCDEAGIRISNRTDSTDVRILGGSIRDTGRTWGSNGSCITAGVTGRVRHPGLVIDGVAVDACGFNDLDHGIYVQAQDYVIRDVLVGDVTGNGISVRSSGLVEGATVRGKVGDGKARIRYYNDHPCGPSDTVRFLDNDVDYDATPGDLDVSLLWSGGDDDLACGRYVIRGNGPAARVAYQIRPEFDALDVTLVE
jgi:hypothetical protein